jgi:hypothetical protein
MTLVAKLLFVHAVLTEELMTGFALCEFVALDLGAA